MAAVIGALRVDLGLNSAEFSAGLRKASNGLGNFAKTAGVGLAVVTTAALAVGTALSVAVKGAIDNADHMDEMAQSAGVSVEALTRLGYAAKFSGLDAESLATGLRKLSQNMLAVAQGATGPAATAFSALGISVQNANGTLRGSDEVLTDVADKFARMEDGAQKTALAVQLFGKSGADLLPFLNEGKDGIAALTAEADRLGITISGSTASAAGQFNDTLDRLRGTFDGFINRIMAGALPSLNALATKLGDPAFARAAAALAQGIVGAINLVVDAISGAGAKLAEFGNLLDYLSSHDWFTGEIDPAKMDARKRGAMAELGGQLKRGEMEAPDQAFMDSVFGSSAAATAVSSKVVADAFVPVITNATAAGAATSALSEAMSQGKAVFDATRTPAEAYGLEVERLNGLLQQGAIDQDTYNRAVLAAQDSLDKAKSAGSELASSLSSGLADVFTSIIDGSKSATAAIGDLVGSLGKMLLNKGFEALLGNIFGGFKIPGFANGTNFAPGGLALVGERGPEVVNLPRGSQVTPNGALGKGVGASLNVTYHIDAKGAEIGVEQKILAAIKSNNRQLPQLMQDVQMRQG